MCHNSEKLNYIYQKKLHNGPTCKDPMYPVSLINIQRLVDLDISMNQKQTQISYEKKIYFDIVEKITIEPNTMLSKCNL